MSFRKPHSLCAGHRKPPMMPPTTDVSVQMVHMLSIKTRERKNPDMYIQNPNMAWYVMFRRLRLDENIINMRNLITELTEIRDALDPQR